MALFNYLKSTILSKVVMAITGIILVLFIFVHTLGNLQIYLGSDSFNTYAHFLQSVGEVLWIMRIALFLALVLHVITSIRLKLINLDSKPTKYQVKSFLKARLSSRTMLWTGVMILAFVIYHVAHFTMGVTNPEDYNKKDYYQKEVFSTAPNVSSELLNKFDTQVVEKGNVIFVRHDVYKMVILGFRNPVISAVYILGMILLGFHLSHAMQSSIQTLGWSSPDFTAKMMKASQVIAFLVAFALSTIPLSILFGLVGGQV